MFTVNLILARMSTMAGYSRLPEDVQTIICCCVTGLTQAFSSLSATKVKTTATYPYYPIIYS